MTDSVNPGQSTSVARTRRTVALARGAEALELRLAGNSFEQIASRLDYSDKSGAWRAVEGELRKVRHEHAAEAVALDLARLDKVLNAVWSKAMDGDPVAIDRVLKVIERRAKYFDLDGRASSTSDQLLAAQELAHADVLARLAQIKERIDSRLILAVADELSRLSKSLPVQASPWETATVRLEAFEKETVETTLTVRSQSE